MKQPKKMASGAEATWAATKVPPKVPSNTPGAMPLTMSQRTAPWAWWARRLEIEVMTMPAIDVPRATLYYSFSGKDDLVTFFMNEKVGRISALVGNRPALAYRLFGLLATLALVAAADRWLRLAGLPDRHRLGALLLVTCGAGLGGVRYLLAGPPARRTRCARPHPW